jgi:hypothetical protein
MDGRLLAADSPVLPTHWHKNARKGQICADARPISTFFRHGGLQLTE